MYRCLTKPKIPGLIIVTVITFDKLDGSVCIGVGCVGVDWSNLLPVFDNGLIDIILA